MSDPHVTFEPGGHAIRAAPGETILEAALREGLDLAYGCREGTCGTCRASLLRGRVDYPEGLPPALEPAAAAAGEVLLCRAVPVGEVLIALPEAEAGEAAALPPARTFPARVERIERAAPDVARLWLRPPEAIGTRHLAGQHVEVLLPDGRRRVYSIASAPGEPLLELHVARRAGGAFTERVFGSMRPGEVLRLHGPLGAFRLRTGTGRPVVLVAGGTGFAPFKAMLEQALPAGDPARITLYWGARGPEGLYLHDLVTDWGRAHAERFRYVPVLSEDVPPDWDGARGLVHEAVLAGEPELAGCDVYLAGPPAMVTAARAALRARGVPETRIYCDSFEPARDQGAAGAS